MLSFEEWPGTLGTVTRTPDRLARSLRRTTSIRSTWPDGLDGHLALTARGRDLLTTDTGAGVVVSDARVDVHAEGSAKTVRSITSEPAVAHLPLLEGVNARAASAGRWRRTSPPGEGSVLALLLDDLPGAALVSGSARLRATIEATGELPGFTDVDLPVVCIGRRHDGVMARRRSEGRPLIGQGPPAGHLDRPDDSLSPGHRSHPFRCTACAGCAASTSRSSKTRSSSTPTSGTPTRRAPGSSRRSTSMRFS